MGSDIEVALALPRVANCGLDVATAAESPSAWTAGKVQPRDASNTEPRINNRWRLGVRRILTVVAATALLASLTAALAGATGNRAKLQLRRTGVGTILANSRGFTVYVFTRDARNRDNCAKVSGCLSIWPPVTTSGKAVAGRGVSSRLIGTITLKSGLKQVTYAGHPLYTYVADSAAGQTFYVNVSQFGGRWPAVNAAGNRVK